MWPWISVAGIVAIIGLPCVALWLGERHDREANSRIKPRDFSGE